jgi:hypothetical protein
MGEIDNLIANLNKQGELLDQLYGKDNKWKLKKK